MQQRRLAAIMFTDIVGYSALMEKDEMDTLIQLSGIHAMQRNLVERYRGTVVKEIGDGLLAYFDHASDGVLCGTEIQKTLSESEQANIRIGLHWSEIILKDGDIYGDGVNIASRIESLADPGGIYISEAMKIATGYEDLIEFKYMGRARLKNVKRPVIIYAVQGEDLPTPSMKRFQGLANPGKKIAVIPALIAFLLIITVAFFVIRYFDRRAEVIEASASLDQIEELVNLNWRDYSEAYFRAKEVESIIPKNKRLKSLIDKTSVHIDINSDPAGARVSYKQYNLPEQEWKSLGVTPLDSIEVPISIFRWKFEKEGYEPVLAASMTFEFKDMSRMKQFDMYRGKDLFRVLDEKGQIPAGMTRVIGNKSPPEKFGDFFIDKFEVSNREYKTFIEKGGYKNPTYWHELIEVIGDSIKWEEAIQVFTDRTGNPGPSEWEYQNFPEGEANYPVCGINWFEANAYARFAGKFIPTKDHWGIARGEGTLMVMPQLGGNAIFAPYNNFHGEGPQEAGFYKGITSYGAYDMAGNLREWCYNRSEHGRWIRGGAWNDNPYMFGAPSEADPFDRSERNGFRCVLYPEPDKIPESAFARKNFPARNRILEIPEPITGEQFDDYKVFYEYDKTDLNDKIVVSSENEEGWILEKIEFDAAYDNERMSAFFFLPTNTEPPYQSVLYGPGSNVLYQDNSEDIENFFEFTAFCEFLVKRGRAIIFPVFKGSFERRNERSVFAVPKNSHQFTSNITRIIKDYRRCLDYMETREDINMDKIAFYGMSMGPVFGVYLSAIDERVKTDIFYAGGLNFIGRPEVNMMYFLPRITIPTLMINGRYDAIYPVENIINMYNLLGTPEEDRKLVLHNSDHLAPVELLVSETTFWLDKYLGEVDYSIEIEQRREPLVAYEGHSGMGLK